ncbi:MAG: hypothetical protein U9Q97_10270 [Acidobacteriota bacterium]|nr:hypothetical protein [Acidobacteriota bacterium]
MDKNIDRLIMFSEDLYEDDGWYKPVYRPSVLRSHVWLGQGLEVKVKDVYAMADEELFYHMRDKYLEAYQKVSEACYQRIEELANATFHPENAE